MPPPMHKGSQTFARLATLHFMQQGHQHACSRSSDRVADGNCTAIDVDFAHVPFQLRATPATARQKLRSLRSGPDPATSSRLWAKALRVAETGPMPMISGAHPVRACFAHGSHRLEPQFSGLASRHQHDGCCTIIDARGIAGRDGSVLLEGRPHFGQNIHRDTVTDKFVSGNDRIALALRKHDRGDFSFELASLLGSLGTILRQDRKLVLLLHG